MIKRTCPKCSGTGTSGYVSAVRCEPCRGHGELEIKSTSEYRTYVQMCADLGVEPTKAYEFEPPTDVEVRHGFDDALMGEYVHGFDDEDDIDDYDEWAPDDDDGYYPAGGDFTD